MKGWLTTELYIARWGFLLYSLLWIAACVVFVVDCEIKDRAIASLTAERDSLRAVLVAEGHSVYFEEGDRLIYYPHQEHLTWPKKLADTMELVDTPWTEAGRDTSWWHRKPGTTRWYKKHWPDTLAAFFEKEKR